MKRSILYPYNEILPTKKAHDLFVFQECAALAASGFQVELLHGTGSYDEEALFSHYGIKNRFKTTPLPIIRKNNPFNVSWNLPFFWLVQRKIERIKPDFVFLSVLKQGSYHLKRKIRGSFYVYEVHELGMYPNGTSNHSQVEREIDTLSRADLITVTTAALYEILKAPPYSLKNRIEIVPLGVHAKKLNSPEKKREPILFYVGSLYAGQGLELLLKAFSQTSGIRLKIIGGKKEEISSLKKMASSNVEFLGFKKPEEIPALVKEANAFVAPFTKGKRMPYVAHTKLYEYASWGRPFIAPNLPSVREHFDKGVVLYEADNVSALAEALQRVKNCATLNTLQQEIETYDGHFTWEKRGKTYAKILSSLI